MLYLGLWAGMLKNYCHICDQRLLIYRIAKFRSKIRIFKFGTRNALFGCFGQQFKKPLSYLKSAPSNLRYYKV